MLILIIIMIMLTYASIYEITYYAGNYSSIIGQLLVLNIHIKYTAYNDVLKDHLLYN